MVSNANNIKRITRFFLISHGIPLLLTLIVMLISSSFLITNKVHGYLLYIGYISPTIAALYIAYKFYNQKERKAFFTSMIDLKRIPKKWFLILMLFPFVTRLVASSLDFMFAGNEVFSLSPDMTVLYALFLLPFGPIPEEIGWRGVALPLLKKKVGFPLAVLFLGFMWAIWHLPLFFIEGTYQHNLELLTPLFWNYMFQFIFTSVITGVIYYKSNCSILAAILFHYMVNLVGEAFLSTQKAEFIHTTIIGVIAVISLIYYRKGIENMKRGFINE